MRLPLLALLLLPAACAPPAPAPQAAPAPATWQGQIVAIRPAPDGTLAEFIARDDAGRTISVVQPNADSLRLGARVSLLPSGHARLAPAP